MIIHQIIFAAGGADPSTLGEHSLLMSGHFAQKRIFRAAVENGARLSEFRGIRVLVQQPLLRDLGTLKDVRWLAVIDSTVALFGTISSVQQDRPAVGWSAVDPSLMQKLARLRRDDATWSVVGTVEHNDKARHALRSLNLILANLIHDRDSFQFGFATAARSKSNMKSNHLRARPHKQSRTLSRNLWLEETSRDLRYCLFMT